MIGGAVAGFLVAVLLGVSVLRFSGFELLCKQQILCTVSDDKGWASGIHVTWEADPSDSFTVSWRTASTSNPAIVEYRRAGAGEWQQTRGKSVSLDPNGFLYSRGAIQRATVEGLEPDTVYEYRVSNDSRTGTPTSAVFRTRTAPSGPAPFSFIFFADTGLAGRPDGLAAGVATLQGFLGEADVSFLLGGGDYAYANTDGRYVFPGDAVAEWFRQWQPILSRLPFLPQYGNHEIFLREGLAHWGPRFGHRKGFDGGRAYSFDVGRAHFAAMFAPGDGYLPPGDLLAWLDEDLDAARRNGARWLIVYQHDSLFGHGLSHPADPRLRRLLMPILEKHEVDLHLSAQDQSYERTFPLRTGAAGIGIATTETADYAAGEGVIYLKVSPAGKMSEITRSFSTLTRPQPPEIARRSDDGFHFARVDVTRDRLDVIVYKLRPGEGEPAIFDRIVIRQAPADAPAGTTGRALR